MANEEVHSTQTLFNCSHEIEQYKCETCPNYQTNSLARLRSHIREDHIDENLEEDFYKCSTCLFATNSIYLIGQHSLFSACATNEDERQERFLCYQTNTELNSRFNDSETSGRKSKIKRFRCEQCTIKFKEKKSLKRHTKKCHSKSEDIRWFECANCRAKFKRKSTLAIHTITRHQKPEDIQWLDCELCSLKFKTKNNLGRHKKRCHSKPEDVQWFQCERCPYKCKQKSHLKQHFQARHADPEDIDWHRCELCTYKCKQRPHLFRHIKLIHAKPEDIKWFECNQCESKFKQKSDLTSHVSAGHPKPVVFNRLIVSYVNLSLKEHLKTIHSKHEDLK